MKRDDNNPTLEPRYAELATFMRAPLEELPNQENH
jgi:hypothetical protein